MISIRNILAIFKNLQVIGNGDVQIDGLNLTNRSSDRNCILSFAVSAKYADNVKKAEHVKALIITRENLDAYLDMICSRDGCVLIADNPEVAFYRIHEYLYKHTDFYDKFDFPTHIGEDCCIHPKAVIDDGVIIGDRVIIGAGTVVKRGSIIEDDTVIGCNSVIGSEGFQLITVPGEAPMHITHVGKCHISKNVYVGDNTCVCNSLFEGETYVASGAKIDNFVHVAHNLYVGENAVLTAHVILCGSSRIEAGAWIGPNSSVLNRVVVGEGAKIGLGSVVTRDVAPYTLVYGSPAKVH